MMHSLKTLTATVKQLTVFLVNIKDKVLSHSHQYATLQSAQHLQNTGECYSVTGFGVLVLFTVVKCISVISRISAGR